MVIDTHAHFLPGLDDGSKDRAMTEAMLRLAAARGTSAIFATPHVVEAGKLPLWEAIVEQVDQWQAWCKEQQLGLRLAPGAEVYLNWDLLEVIGQEGPSGRAYCYGGGNYVLVELPVAVLPSYTEEFFYRLALKGLQPVLAHVERYPMFFERRRELYKFKEKGYLFQLNGNSLRGFYGKRVEAQARALLKEQAIDLLGSDGHRAEGRDTDLAFVEEALMALDPEYRDRLLFKNGQALLAGQPIEATRPVVSAGAWWRRLFHS